MKNLLLILVMLIAGVTNAQNCNLEIFDECPSVAFNFSTEECSGSYNLLYSDEIEEIEEIVALFFTELAYYNDANVNYGGEFNQDAYVLKQSQLYLYPYDGIVAEDYTVDIDFYPFTGSLRGRAANATTCNGDIIHIEVNSSKWFTELDNEELDNEGNIWENNQNNPVLPRLKKKFLIYHELGHAVLNLDHNCSAGVDQYADIMETSQCPIAPGSQYNLSFPFDFPVFTDNSFKQKTNKMFSHTDQVDFPACESSSSSSAAATYPSQSSAGAQSQAPREYYEGETIEEYYGDTNLTNDQLQNRISAIDDISDTYVTVKYGWETLNQVYFIELTDLLPDPIDSEVAAVPNLTTLTYSEFKSVEKWTFEWRNAFLSKIANNHLPNN